MDIQVLRFDLRPGGMFHYSMTSAERGQMFGRFSYREIFEPERLVWVNSFADEAGNIIPSSFLADKFPLEILNVMTLTEDAGKTTLTLRGCPINATEDQVQFYQSMFPSMEKGFGGTFGQLEAYLEKLKS